MLVEADVAAACAGAGAVSVDREARGYKLLMLSSIPVVQRGDGYESLDLWVVDLAAQVKHTKRFCLVCPVIGEVPKGWQGSSRLPGGIEIVSLASFISGDAMQELLPQFDVVQVNAGQGWFEARSARLTVHMARRLGVASIVGISSDRARTTLMNAKPRTLSRLPAAAKSLIRYLGLKANYARLTASADGTFIVGAGLRSLVSKRSPSVHVGTASWIKDADLSAARSRYALDGSERNGRACIAARLERMKGVHVGIEAFYRISVNPRLAHARLDVFGAGPERSNLETLVSEMSLSGRVTFCGTLSYPDQFMAALRRFEIVVLSNLNVEQPRLVFDAISQGCIPVCPDNVVYRSLGLPSEVLYQTGDSESLGNLLTKIMLKQFDRAGLAERLLEVGECFTLESMHRLRAEWVATLLPPRPHG